MVVLTAVGLRWSVTANGKPVRQSARLSVAQLCQGRGQAARVVVDAERLVDGHVKDGVRYPFGGGGEMGGKGLLDTGAPEVVAGHGQVAAGEKERLNRRSA